MADTKVAETRVLDELRKSEFLRGIPDEQLTKLAAICRPVEFPARSTVFEQYGLAKNVYVIVSGEISLAICDPEESCRQIGVVHGGDLMGWSPLVGRMRLYDTARCVTAVRALEFEGSKLMDFCAANSPFGFEFMRRVACVLAERLSGARLQLLEISGMFLPEFPVESD
ncbi:MAG TPA: Crp/Fnr family transcriptional regulator [Lacipirellulaceae bacterium]|jgi:CRP-like cAMP-binding protein